MDNANLILKLKKEKARLLEKVPSFKRVSFARVEEAIADNAFPILFGLRRVGKTTILRQLMEKNKETSIYISFRNTYISRLTRMELSELIESLYDEGIVNIYMDEVQLYKEWSDFIIEMFDSFPKLNMVITGSSSLNLEKRETGLDRTRKINIQTLSFGEYINISGNIKNKETFENYLGHFGFPKYANDGHGDFDIQRSEIFDEIINNDIPAEFKNIDTSLISRLTYELSKLTNGEVNMARLVSKVSKNLIERDALKYIEILEKCKILKTVGRINSDLSEPRRRKFKVYINPHIHLWLLDKEFCNLDPKIKGHIVESYWLHWAMAINNYSKTFYYLKDAKTNKEVDFISFDHSSNSNKIKTLHEMKYTKSKMIDLSFMKKFPSENKIVWNITGESVDGVEGKNILDTFDKPL